MSANQVALWYLVASICFIFALKGLSHPTTARRGNALGIIGMAIAVLVTLAVVFSATKNVAMILVGIAVGGAIGAVIARRVQMTQMPELVAALHSLVGMAAVLIAAAVVNNPRAGLANPFPGTSSSFSSVRFIGAITFSGSVIALGFSGRIRSAPVVFPGQQLNRDGRRDGRLGIWFFMADPREHYWLPYVG
jgi:NAD(P) transhydrogenase subunit beta